MIDTFSESWLKQKRTLRGHLDLFIQRCELGLGCTSFNFVLTWLDLEDNIVAKKGLRPIQNFKVYV